MAEVLEKDKSSELKTVSFEKDTWILELPAEICSREGFAEGTMVSLTFRGCLKIKVCAEGAVRR